MLVALKIVSNIQKSEKSENQEKMLQNFPITMILIY